MKLTRRYSGEYSPRENQSDGSPIPIAMAVPEIQHV
jgi:hypothetical protein